MVVNRISYLYLRIAEWMRSNRCCLNSEKTEFLWCATSRRCPHLDTGELSVCVSVIHPVAVVRDLGVMLHSFIHSFIHIEHLYSASSRKLLSSALNTSMVKQSSLKVRKNAGEVVLLKMRSSEGR